MNTYTLKSVARRGSMLAAAFAIVIAAVAPAASIYADALNPLTDRSLTLSSSSPGWDYKDGSGNATYAQPNSGANGQKTGNTFEFKVSTDSTTSPAVKGFTFQYCTASAGDCTAPGDNGQSGGVRNLDSATTSDLNVATSTPVELSSGNFTSLIDTATGIPTGIPNRDDSQGNFTVLTKNGTNPWVRSAGWVMDATNLEDGDITSGTATGANNYIRLINTTGANPAAGDSVKIIFFGTDGNYITNPGSGAFFVKINSYKDVATTADLTAANVIDGGVTVANVMNQSITITTKVLETMDFSVGTVDPYTLESLPDLGGGEDTTSALYAATGQKKHGQCDPIKTKLTTAGTEPVNTLQLGDIGSENSLSTSKTYSTHSYWRLSSNSSAGATVYYSGVTLKNTVGDEIAAIGAAPAAPIRGTPQFGLALSNGTSGVYAVDYNKETNGTTGVFENGADQSVAGIDASVATDISSQGLAGYHDPQLFPLVAGSAYDKGAGNVNSEYGAVDTEFAFDPSSNLVPTPIASEETQVVDCVTAKVRYIANIAATTPAGIYTTKINYIAAPQY